MSLPRIFAVAPVAAALLAAPVAGAAFQPPPGTPDLAAMALAARDLPAGATLQGEGYSHGPGVAAAYTRVFSFRRSSVRRAGLVSAYNAVFLLGNADDAKAQFGTVRGRLRSAKGRRKLARIFAAAAGLPARDVRAGEARTVRIADGAVMLPITATLRHHSLTAAEAFMRVDRVETELTILGAPDAGHVVRRARELLRVVGGRIRRGLAPSR